MQNFASLEHDALFNTMYIQWHSLHSLRHNFKTQYMRNMPIIYLLLFYLSLHMRTGMPILSKFRSAFWLTMRFCGIIISNRSFVYFRRMKNFPFAMICISQYTCSADTVSPKLNVVICFRTYHFLLLKI